ncbi:MAG: aminotransferase class III-fold pyridoxal phosphate-dependent enzyme, partial [Aestuariivirgaceae bacterium]
KGGEFFHGYTYSGHPVACAVALENIRIMKDERLVERGAETAPYLKTALAGLADHPLVGEVRSKGLIGAFELVRNKATRERFEPPSRVGLICRDHCFRNGLIMRACWDTMVFAPPLVIERAEIDQWMALARKALDQTLQDVRGEMA